MKISDRVYWVGSGTVGISAQGDCHTYLIEGDNSLALIDCGMNADPQAILENVKREGHDIGRIRYCFLTHAHYDHAGGCYALRKLGIQMVGSSMADAVLRNGAIQTYGLAGDDAFLHNWRSMPISQLDIVAQGKREFDLGGVVVRTVKTPGHSPDSMCYLAMNDKGKRRELFSGDTIFYKGFISVLAPPLNDLQHYPQGLKALHALNVDGLYPGHLMWVLQNGQQYIDTAIEAFENGQMPPNKPFS
ncbi:MAG: MBL fold metallo-hydrolase [Clostridia bacterium]